MSLISKYQDLAAQLFSSSAKAAPVAQFPLELSTNGTKGDNGVYGSDGSHGSSSSNGSDGSHGMPNLTS